MQRKFKFALCIFLAIVALLCTASAVDIYVAADGDDTAAGTADAPVATLTQAYTLLGADGGTVLLADTVPVTATSSNCYIEPTHSAKITVTSAPDANGALDLTGIKHFHFSGETEWNSNKTTIFFKRKEVAQKCDFLSFCADDALERTCLYAADNGYNDTARRRVRFSPCAIILVPRRLPTVSLFPAA